MPQLKIPHAATKIPHAATKTQSSQINKRNPTKNTEKAKKWGKKDTYVCITESLCCTPETNTTLYFNYTSIKKRKKTIGNSLAVQRLGLSVFTAVAPGSIPGWGTNILQAAWCGQKNQTKTNQNKKLLYIGWINNKVYCIAQGTLYILWETIMEKNMKNNV